MRMGVWLFMMWEGQCVGKYCILSFNELVCVVSLQSGGCMGAERTG